MLQNDYIAIFIVAYRRRGLLLNQSQSHKLLSLPPGRRCTTRLWASGLACCWSPTAGPVACTSSTWADRWRPWRNSSTLPTSSSRRRRTRPRRSSLHCGQGPSTSRPNMEASIDDHVFLILNTTQNNNPQSYNKLAILSKTSRTAIQANRPKWSSRLWTPCSKVKLSLSLSLSALRFRWSSWGSRWNGLTTWMPYRASPLHSTQRTSWETSGTDAFSIQKAQ